MDEGKVEGVARLRRPERAERDAAAERRGVAHHLDVAVDDGGDLGQHDVAEVDLRRQSAEHEPVRVGLVDLGELLPVLQRHGRPRGRERVREDVAGVHPVPAVHRHVLVDEPRGEREPLGGLQQHGHAGAGPPAVVHVLADAQVRLHGVDEAADGGVVRGDAERRRRPQGHVDGELRVVAEPAAGERAEAELARSLGDPEGRLVGDVAHRARQRARAEQVPCGPRSTSTRDMSNRSR